MAWSRGDTLTGPAGRGAALAPYYTMAATFLSGADNSTSEGGGMEGWIHLPSRSSWTCQRLCWRPPGVAVLSSHGRCKSDSSGIHRSADARIAA